MITLRALTKHFPGSLAPVVAGIDLDIGKGEICVLLGPSGCGKTTTLKMINRLIQPTSGKIFIDGRDTDEFDVVELRRRIGYVIQQIGLFPNMTVEENISVVPSLLGWDKAKARARAAELLEIVALEPSMYLSRYPRDLSGGQQQRVGVARALATDPPVMLMDEPFGAIDPINRSLIQDEFLRIQTRVRKTIVFVSHDIDEAVKMADKIAIFRNGHLEQVDSPDNILARPNNAFVAGFVGSDKALKRLRLRSAGQVATHGDCVIRAGQRSEVADELMTRHGLGAIVIVDDQAKPIGFFSKEQADSEAFTLSADQALPLPGAVKLEDDLRSVVSSMFASGSSWLPAIDQQGRFRGYLVQSAIEQLVRDSA